MCKASLSQQYMLNSFRLWAKYVVFFINNIIDRYLEYDSRQINKIKSTVASKSTSPPVTAKQDRQCNVRIIVNIRRVRATIVAVEKQTADLHKTFSQNDFRCCFET